MSIIAKLHLFAEDEIKNCITNNDSADYCIKETEKAMAAARDILEKGEKQLPLLKQRKEKLQIMKTKTVIKLCREKCIDKIQYRIYKIEIFEDGSIKSNRQLYAAQGKHRYDAKKYFNRLKDEHPEWEYVNETSL